MKRFWLKSAIAMHAPLLSIRLNDDFGKQILSDSTLLVTNKDFLSNYYGLRVAVEPVENSFGKMLYFNPTAEETKLVLYYTNSDSSLSYKFVINNDCTRFINYETDHTKACADLQNQLNSSSPTSGDQRLYLQPLKGVRIKVNFSGIEELRKKKNIVINEAKLFLYNAEPYEKTLLPTKQLAIQRVNSEGKLEMISDNMIAGAYFGGSYDSDKNRYVMRITRYLQQRILDETMDNDNLYISISGASFYANRVMLYGNNPNENDKKAKIRILYSEY
jgi:hypothetical protein